MKKSFIKILFAIFTINIFLVNVNAMENEKLKEISELFSNNFEFDSEYGVMSTDLYSLIYSEINDVFYENDINDVDYIIYLKYDENGVLDFRNIEIEFYYYENYLSYSESYEYTITYLSDSSYNDNDKLIIAQQNIIEFDNLILSSIMDLDLEMDSLISSYLNDSKIDYVYVNTSGAGDIDVDETIYGYGIYIVYYFIDGVLYDASVIGYLVNKTINIPENIAPDTEQIENYLNENLNILKDVYNTEDITNIKIDSLFTDVQGINNSYNVIVTKGGEVISTVITIEYVEVNYLEEYLKDLNTLKLDALESDFFEYYHDKTLYGSSSVIRDMIKSNISDLIQDPNVEISISLSEWVYAVKVTLTDSDSNTFSKIIYLEYSNSSDYDEENLELFEYLNSEYTNKNFVVDHTDPNAIVDLIALVKNDLSQYGNVEIYYSEGGGPISYAACGIAFIFIDDVYYGNFSSSVQVVLGIDNINSEDLEEYLNSNKELLLEYISVFYSIDSDFDLELLNMLYPTMMNDSVYMIELIYNEFDRYFILLHINSDEEGNQGNEDLDD